MGRAIIPVAPSYRVGGAHGAPATTAARIAVADTVIASDSEERRALLLAVLKMHHLPVVGSAPSPEILSSLADGGSLGSKPFTLLLDADLTIPEWRDAAARFIAGHPGTRAVWVTPSRSNQAERLARDAQIQSILHRPFSIQQLLEAVGEPTMGAAGDSPAQPSRSQDGT